MKRKRWFCWLRRIALGALVLLALAWVALRFVPLPERLLAGPPESLELLDREGRRLRETRIGGSFRRELAPEEIPQHVRHAMLAAEDKRFFSHGGVDWLASARALTDGLRAGRISSGASTISQQLVKISSPPRARTLRTKCIEMAVAMRLEQVWDKERILAAYLNRVDFGSLNFGIAAAADYYFGKSPRDLSEAEAALLTGLPLNPARLNPLSRPDSAKRRQETVLRRMHANGWLDAAGLQRALAEPLNYIRRPRTFHAPHFADLVLQSFADASEKPGDPRLRLAGSVRTTLDLELNRFIEATVTEKLAKLRDHNVRDAAVVVLDNRTREIIGLTGSQNYFAPGSGMVNGATTPRSAGSTMKPFTCLLAMERGATPATVLADVPTEFSTSTGPYRPENYHRHCQGPVRLREALACSLNIPAVKTLQIAGGPLALQRRLQGWGVTTLPRDAAEYGLGLTIGNAEVTLTELVNLYATLARDGEWQPVRMLAGIATPAPAPQRPPVPPVRREFFWLLADILADNTARQPQFGAASPLRFDFPVACKTGTSTDFRDNWAVAYTPEFTVGVWVGNFDGTPMVNVSGVSGAGPVMHEVMKHLHRTRGTTWFARPAGIVERTVHPFSGKLAAAGVVEKFAAGQLPPAGEPSDFDALGRVLLGAEYARWFASADNHLRDRVVVASAGGVFLVSPVNGSVFIVDPDVPSTARIPLVAHGRGVEWSCTGMEIREENGRFYAIATEGEHRITARDPTSGKTAESRVVVRGL